MKVPKTIPFFFAAIVCFFMILPPGFSSFLDKAVQVLKTATSGTPPDASKSFIETSVPEVKVRGVIGENTQDASFSVRNTGAGTLNFTVKSTMSWLEVIPEQGTSSAGSEQKINLRFKTADLKEGNYVAPVVIEDANAQNSPRTVLVRLEMLPGAVLALDQKQLSAKFRQGENASDQTFMIQNLGAGMLNYSLRLAFSADDGSAWMAAEPANGQISGNQSASATIKMKTSAMSAGAHVATITVTAPGAENSPQNIQVTAFVMTNDVLSLSAQELSAEGVKGKPVNPQILRVVNTSSSVVTIKATAKDPWFSVMPASKTLQGGEEVVLTINYETKQLQPGEQTSEIVITDEAAKTLKKIPVKFKLTVPPVIAIDAEKLDFKAKAGKALEGSGNFVIKNDGDGTLNFQCVKDAPWLELGTVSGKLEKGDSAQIDIKVHTSGLPVGEHLATIQVTDPNAENSPQKLPVKLIIVAGGALSLDMAKFQVEAKKGETVPTKILVLRNSGNETVSYKISSDVPWMEVPAVGQVNAGQQQTIEVAFKPGDLPAGPQPGRIVIEYGEKQTLTVEAVLVLKEEKKIIFVPAQLAFAGTRGRVVQPQTFEMLYQGSKNLEYQWKASEKWVTVNSEKGSIAPGQKLKATVSCDLAMLELGDYQAALQVIDIQTGNAAQSFPVSLKVGKTTGKPGQEVVEDFTFDMSGKTWENRDPVVDANLFEGYRVPNVLKNFVIPGKSKIQSTGAEDTYDGVADIDYTVQEIAPKTIAVTTWNASVLVHFYSPRALWGHMDKHDYDEATGGHHLANDWKKPVFIGSAPLPAEESQVFQWTATNYNGKEHFCYIRNNGIVARIRIDESPKLYQEAHNGQSFDPNKTVYEPLQKAMQTEDWKKIFRSDNPHYDRLPNSLKPLVKNIGYIRADDINLQVRGFDGASPEMELRYSARSLPLFNAASGWKKDSYVLHFDISFRAPGKESEERIEKEIGWQIDDWRKTDTYFETNINNNPGLGDSGAIATFVDPGTRGTWPHRQLSGVRWAIRFKNVYFRCEYNPDVVDRVSVLEMTPGAEEQIMAVFNELKNMDTSVFFKSAASSEAQKTLADEMSEPEADVPPPLTLAEDFWNPEPDNSEKLPPITLQGGPSQPQAAAPVPTGPQSGDRNEQGLVWSPVAGGGWVKPEIYETDFAMIQEGKVYTDQWGWVSESEAKERDANYQKFQAANQASDQKRQAELKQMSEDIRKTKQEIREAETRRAQTAALRKKEDELRDKLNGLEKDMDQAARDSRWYSRSTMTATAQMTAREIVTGEDAEGGMSIKSMAARMLIGGATLGWSEVAYTGAGAGYTMVDNLRKGRSIMDSAAITALTMIGQEAGGQMASGLFTWAGGAASRGVRKALGMAPEVGTEGLSKELVRKKMAIQKALGIKDEATQAKAIKELFPGAGRGEMIQLEGLGQLGKNEVKKINSVINKEVNEAFDEGMKKTIKEFQGKEGVQIKEVMAGDSGSSATGRVASINTDADFTVRPNFEESTLKVYADKYHGGDLMKADRELCKKLAEAQESFMDTSLRARGLSAHDVRSQIYNGSGLSAGPGDAYARGFVETRQAVQGKTKFFKVEEGEIKSYKTSGQAMTDQDLLIRKDLLEKEIKRLDESMPGASPREAHSVAAKKQSLEKELTELAGEDSPKVKPGEAESIMKKQKEALSKTDELTAEKASKALERADKALALQEAAKNLEILKKGGKVADLDKIARIDPALLEKARLIRANPQQVKQILGGLSEDEFIMQVDAAAGEASRKIKGN